MAQAERDEREEEGREASSTVVDINSQTAKVQNKRGSWLDLRCDNVREKRSQAAHDWRDAALS